MGKWYTARTLVQRRLLWAIVLSLLLVLSASIAHIFIPSTQAHANQGSQRPGAIFTRSTTTPAPTITPGITPTATPSSPLPRFDHIVVAIEENKNYSEIIGQNSPATYINSLVPQGALFTNARAITHPSQPNYLDLFSGSDQGVKGDACSAQKTYPGPNLGGQLIKAGFSFAGYSESQPSAGFTGCYDTSPPNNVYARKHNPWANFSDVNGTTTNLSFTSFPTTTAGFSSLPTVSFVVPNLLNDMHTGSTAADIQQGDTWLQQHLDAYAQWAKTHNSLFIVTFDEGEGISSTNQIATVFVGQHVQAGSTNGTSVSHYNVLRTLEDMYGLTPANNAATATDITGIWN